MKAPVVLDASAALRLFLGDGPLPAGLEDAVAAAASGELVLLVPDLFWIEVSHVLLRMQRAGALTELECDGLLRDLRELPCQTRAHASLLDAVVVLVRTHRLSAYDATYLALAQAVNAQLLTTDRQLAAKI